MAEIVDLPAFRTRQAAARAEGRYLGIGFASLHRGGPGPEPRAAGGGVMGNENMRMRLDADGIVLGVHRPDAARAEPRDDVRPDRGRRARRAVRAGAGRRRRQRHRADRASDRRQPGGDDGRRRHAPHGRARCSERILDVSARPPRGQPRRPRDRRRRGRGAGRPRERDQRWPRSRRGAPEPTRSDPGVRRRRGRMVGRHPLRDRRRRRRDRAT